MPKAVIDNNAIHFLAGVNTYICSGYSILCQSLERFSGTDEKKYEGYYPAKILMDLLQIQMKTHIRRLKMKYKKLDAEIGIVTKNLNCGEWLEKRWVSVLYNGRRILYLVCTIKEKIR